MVVELFAGLADAALARPAFLGLFFRSREYSLDRLDNDMHILAGAQHLLQGIDDILPGSIADQHAQYPAFALNGSIEPHVGDTVLFSDSEQGVHVTCIGNDLDDTH